MPPPSANERGPSVKGSLLSRAKSGDADALRTMFRQFLDEDEQVVQVCYLGVMGLFFGNHSFGCVTDRRVATIRSGSFGEVLYQDGYLEDINSTVVHQPGIWKLYLAFGIYSIIALTISLKTLPLGGLMAFFISFTLLSIPMIILPAIYYRFVKSGLVTIVREGVSVYMFTDRHRLARANVLLRTLSVYRERRRPRAT